MTDIISNVNDQILSCIYLSFQYGIEIYVPRN